MGGQKNGNSCSFRVNSIQDYDKDCNVYTWLLLQQGQFDVNNGYAIQASFTEEQRKNEVPVIFQFIKSNHIFKCK